MIKLLEIAKKLNMKDMFEGFNDEELTEQYPESFDFEELKNINPYAGKKRYVESHLGKPIGGGSSRVVYRVDKTKVLKLAKNEKGLTQNSIEIDWGTEFYFENILAKVYEFDEQDQHWVEMELALKAGVNDFRRLWDVEFGNLIPYLTNKYNENNGKQKVYSIDNDISEQLDENENVQTLFDFMSQSDSVPGDLTKKSS